MDGIGEGIGAQPERATEGLGQAQEPSKGSDAKVSSLLHREGALTFKARVKEGPSQPAEPPAASMTHTLEPVLVC